MVMIRRSTLSMRSTLASLARRRPEAEAHGWSQSQDLDGRPREHRADPVGECLLTPAIENRRHAGPRTQSDIARSGSSRHHPIPECLTVQCRLARAEGRLEGLCGPGHEVYGRELEPGGRLRLTGATREPRKVLVDRVPY